MTELESLTRSYWRLQWDIGVMYEYLYTSDLRSLFCNLSYLSKLGLETVE